MKRDDYRDLHDQINKLKRGYQIRNVFIWIVLMSIIAFLALGCSKDELAQPKQPTFTEISQIDAEPLGNFGIVLDTIPVEEYYTVTSKLSSATPDSIWSDTIKRTVIRTLSRWLEDGITFVENRRDTLIVYHNGTQGVWMIEDWKYWTIED